MLASLASHITALFVHQVWICLDVQDSLLMEKYSKKNSEQKNAQFYIEKMWSILLTFSTSARFLGAWLDWSASHMMKCEWQWDFG